jgi:hypothetical protein
MFREKKGLPEIKEVKEEKTEEISNPLKSLFQNLIANLKKAK